MTTQTEIIKDILNATNDMLEPHGAYLEVAVVNFNDGGEKGEILTIEEAAFDEAYAEAEELNDIFDAFFGRKAKKPVAKQPSAKKTEVDLLAEGLKALDAKFNAYLAAQKADK